ncbi:MAG: ABC transporter permease [Candidatus Nitrosopelagicus sp.]|jgi:ABC-type polysaccharide/polyol phosphate export permease|nr:ABC transporter permease [Candidatus Nitrosopelagicus sp.]|tara:strand:- start:503 stop:1279 length:777 start_codon:yes stop_codon:yes gene_type:complete
MTTIREEMWKTKGILFNFAITDLKIRYRNSILGVLWSLVEPLLLLGVLFVVFSTMFRFEIPNFPIYLLLGIICWNFFKNGTTFALNSLTNRSALITQIYFPRAIPGLSAGITASIMIIFELVVLGIFMIAFGFSPPSTVILLIPILALQLLLILGVSLPLSVLNVKYKDTEFIWSVVVHAGFFLTPIFYQFDMMPDYVQNVLQYSPMVQIVTMAHHVVLYGTLPSINSVLYAVGSISAITVIGYLIFRKFQAKVVEEM